MLLPRKRLRIYPTNLDSGLFGRDWNWNFDFPAFRNSSPMVNIRETDKQFMLDMAVPGMDKKDFKVVLENGVLTISTTKSDANETKEEGFIKQEFGFTSFERSFELPENVETENIDATYQDGVLQIILKKLVEVESESKKMIDIK